MLQAPENRRCRIYLAVLAAFLGSLPTATVAQMDSVTLIEDFDQEIQNRLGGYWNTFAREPSSAAALRVDQPRHGSSGRGLRLRTDRKREGFCGVWFHFFNFHDSTPGYFDASAYSYLSFWVRGQQGGEQLLVKLADERWIKKDDALPVAAVDDFLPAGIEPEWHEVLIPLRRVKGLDLHRLGGLTLEVTQPGSQTIYIDNIAFKMSSQLELKPTIAAVEAIDRQAPLDRAMWVWSSDRLLKDRRTTDDLLDFCHREQINQIWIQLLYRMEKGSSSQGASESSSLEPPIPRCVIRQPEQFQLLLRRAHERSIQVHALDGYPEFCLRNQHRIPLAVVDAIIRFNQDAPSEARWDGIHFDNEPYLMLGWEDPQHREQILLEFLELNAECQRRVARHRPLVYGVDIPFWWQTKDPRDGRVVGQVTYGGKRQAASYHIIDMLDNVGVMDYRDTADGADGMIAHGRDLLAYASQRDAARLYMGVETFAASPTKVHFLVGPPVAEFYRPGNSGPTQRLAQLSRLDGFRLRRFCDGQRIHVGVEIPAWESGAADEVGLARALDQLAAAFSLANISDDSSQWDDALATAEEAIASEPTLVGFRRLDVESATQRRRVPGFLTTAMMLPKITFADNSLDDFRVQSEAADAYFRRHSAYRGLAIHFYETYRAKVESVQPVDSIDPR